MPCDRPLAVPEPCVEAISGDRMFASTTNQTSSLFPYWPPPLDKIKEQVGNLRIPCDLPTAVPDPCEVAIAAISGDRMLASREFHCPPSLPSQCDLDQSGLNNQVRNLRIPCDLPLAVPDPWDVAISGDRILASIINTLSRISHDLLLVSERWPSDTSRRNTL